MPSSRVAAAIFATAFIATFAASVAAQAPVDLGKRNARSKYTLGRVLALQELPDGRVVASDSKEQVFRLVDFAKGGVGLVGKQGDDPENYRTASLILRLPGDSLGLYDPAGRKLIHLTPQATMAAVVPLPPPLLPSKKRLGTLLGIDPTGSLYFNVNEQMDTTTKALSGVANVTRMALGATTDDPQLIYRMRRADQTKPSGIMPFYFRDAIAIRSDGLIARVVADTYQVVWIRNGKESGHTGPLPFTPIPITEAEQQQIKDSTVEAMKSLMAGLRGGGAGAAGGGSADSARKAIAVGSGGGTPTFVIAGGGGAAGGFAAGMAAGAAAASGGDQRVIMNGVGGGAAGSQVVTPGGMNFADMPLGKFPETKPPILSTGVVAIFDNNGNLWVARERVHGDAVPHYDVITEGKGVVARVNLPPGTRLVGFGKNAVYLARDEDGSDWLERYAMPKM